MPALIVKIVGLLYLVHILLLIPNVGWQFSLTLQPDATTPINVVLWAILLSIVIPLTVAASLLRYPDQIVSFIVGRAPIEVEPPKALQATLFAAIGLYFSVQALLSFVSYASALAFYSSEGGGFSATMQLSTATVELGLGLSLIFGARGLSEMVERIRRAGLR